MRFFIDYAIYTLFQYDYIILKNNYKTKKILTNTKHKSSIKKYKKESCDN